MIVAGITIGTGARGFRPARGQRRLAGEGQGRGFAAQPKGGVTSVIARPSSRPALASIASPIRPGPRRRSRRRCDGDLEGAGLPGAHVRSPVFSTWMSAPPWSQALPNGWTMSSPGAGPNEPRAQLSNRSFAGTVSVTSKCRLVPGVNAAPGIRHDSVSAGTGPQFHSVPSGVTARIWTGVAAPRMVAASLTRTGPHGAAVPG